MVAHDAEHDREAEAGPHRPRGLEGLEHPAQLVLAHATALVADGEHHLAVPAPQAHLEPPALGHGLDRVAGEVPEDLLDLVRVDQADVGPRVGVEEDLVVGPQLLAVAQQRDRLLDEGAQVHRPPRPARGTRLEEEAVQGVAQAHRLARDDVQQLPGHVAEPRLGHQHLGGAPDQPSGLRIS